MKKKLARLPSKPGVYFFKNKLDNIIYIGKSVNLKNRVTSYWQNKNIGFYTKKMVKEIADIDFKICNSEFEALLLEAKLINLYQPEYNTRHKDDKSFLGISISQEEYPRVFASRDLKLKKTAFIGPFPSSQEVRQVLKILRQIFSYRSCKRLSKKTCLYYHLRLCQGCCIGYPKKEYKKTINKIKNFLNGNIKALIRQLEKEMKQTSKVMDFEKAAVLKKQIQAINYVVLNWQSLASSSLSINLAKDEKEKVLFEAKKILPQLKNLKRLEAYDVSNILGKQAAGSMVVFKNFIPAKDQYRRFKINKVYEPDDVAMIEEIVQRRFKHQDWQYPSLIIIDGGKGQVGAAFSVLRDLDLIKKILILGLTKPAKGWSASGGKEETIIKPRIKKASIIGWQEIKLEKNNAFLILIQQLRDESHRFARKYHVFLRKKILNI